MGGNPLSGVDPQGLVECEGGVSDEVPGDFGASGAFSIYHSSQKVKYVCRSNPTLNVKTKLAERKQSANTSKF